MNPILLKDLKDKNGKDLWQDAEIQVLSLGDIRATKNGFIQELMFLAPDNKTPVAGAIWSRNPIQQDTFASLVGSSTKVRCKPSVNRSGMREFLFIIPSGSSGNYRKSGNSLLQTAAVMAAILNQNKKDQDGLPDQIVHLHKLLQEISRLGE